MTQTNHKTQPREDRHGGDLVSARVSKVDVCISRIT